jgi:hypothetical protein
VSDGGGVLNALITGGLGATIGTIITAGIQIFSKRGESRATAADLVSKAAGTIVARLDAENRELREALLLLIEVLDEVTPELAELRPDISVKLHAARRAAERTFV